MNTIKGEIEKVTVQGSLSLVVVKAGELKFSSIIIDTPDTATYLLVGHEINIIFKETEVIIGKGKVGSISLQNRIPGTVKSIEKGALLTKVVLDTTVGVITSVITTNAVAQLALQEGTEAIAMVKTNEMMLSE